MSTEAEAQPNEPTSSTVDELMNAVMAETQLDSSKDKELYEDTQMGVREVVTEVLRQTVAKTFEPGEDRISPKLVDAAIARIDEQISRQLDEVLHHEDFKKLESAWRGLRYLVDHARIEDNVEVHMLNCTKEDLAFDLGDQGIEESGYFKKVYTEEMGGHGGVPFGAVIANFEFGPRKQDMDLLRELASVSSMAHAPLVTAASPAFFGIDNWDNMPKSKGQLAGIFADVKRYLHWNSFRETPDARYVALTMPNFMLRDVYDVPQGTRCPFNYEESAADDPNDYLWGNTAFAFGSRMAESFAEYGWCMDVIGPNSGGQVDNLPTPIYKIDDIEHFMPPTQIHLSDEMEYTLADKGFVALTMRKNSDNAVFFAAQSAYRPAEYGNTEEAKAAQANHFLSTQMPYNFLITRLAHFIKILQRENLGSWADATSLQEDLNKWIRNYVIASKPNDTRLLSERPLKDARITVKDWEGKPGFFKIDMEVQPHIKYQGADFSLSLVAQMGKKA